MMASQIDPVVLGAVASAVDRCLARLGATLPAPASTDVGAVAQYWTSALAIAGEDLGLQVAADLPIGAFGLVSYSAITAQTVRDAFETFGREHIGRIVPGMVLRILPADRDHVDLRVHAASDTPLMLALEEFVLAVIFRHQAVLPSAASVRAVSLRRPAPAVSTPWRQFFGVLPRFAQRHSQLRLAAADLQLPLRTASSELHTMVRGAVEAPDTSLASRVRAHVRAHVGDELAPETIARALGVTARTLQRKLQLEQTSVRELITAVRIEVASEMLEYTETPIAEVANAVGFSQPASFSRAFAAATGLAPLEYRKRRQD